MVATLYYWNTPNAHKPVILLEELGIAYVAKPCRHGKQEAGSRKQFASAFSLFESGAVLYAIDRCANETRRLYRVLDTALHDEAWVAGDYSIADMAIYAWVVEHALQRQQLNDTRASFDAQARQCLFGTAA